VAAIRSALDQSLSPLEVLVCDDGSTDDTAARVAAVGDPRIRWIAGPRGGRPAIPRNRGIAAARGEWLAFLDSDDVWLPQKLARQMEAVTQSGHKASCTNGWRVKPGAARQYFFPESENRQFDFDFLMPDNRVICSSALVHRSVIDSTGGFPEAVGLKAIEDYALWLRIVCLTSFDYIDEPLVDYIDDAANSVRAQDVGKWAQRTVIMKDLAAWLRRKKPPRVDYFTAQARRAISFAYIRRMIEPLRRIKILASLFAGEAT
jgi:glycosyltransferase involved in cell wall biosynthesis